MFCKKCGKKLPDDSLFCTHCGTKLDLLKDIQTQEELKHEWLKGEVQKQDTKQGDSKQEEPRREKFTKERQFHELGRLGQNASLRSADNDALKKGLIIVAGACVLFAISFVLINKKGKSEPNESLEPNSIYEKVEKQSKNSSSIKKSSTGQPAKTTAKEEKPATTNSELEYIEGPLSESAYKEISGKYNSDREGDYVNVVSKKSIVRYIVGGHENYTFKEDIQGYIELNNGYLVKVENEGDKYTYLYTKEGNTETLVIDFNDGWCPDLQDYNYETAQYFSRKNGTTTDQENNTSSAQAQKIVAGDYVIGELCKFKQKDGKYYLCPVNTDFDSYVMSVDDWSTGLLFNDGFPFEKDAKIGIAVGVEFTEDEYGIESPVFEYEYDRFYDAVFELMYDGRLQQREQNSLYFQVDEYVLPLCPIITINEKGEITQILERFKS